MTRLMDLKYPNLENMWIMKTWTQIIKNDIIPSQEDKKEQMHSRLQEEECLSSSEKNVDEHFEKELNPLWTIM